MSGLFQATQLTEDSQRAITTQIASQFGELIDAHGLRNIAEAHMNLKTSVDLILVDGQKLQEDIAKAKAEFAVSVEDSTTHAASDQTRHMREIKEEFDKVQAELVKWEDLMRKLDKAQVSAAAEQESIKNYVMEQQQAIEKASTSATNEAARLKAEVGDFVRASIASVGTQQGGPTAGGGGRKKLNEPRDSKIDSIADGISKAAFTLYRENLELHLEEFAEFGPGIGPLLKLVRQNGPKEIRGKLDAWTADINRQFNSALFPPMWDARMAS